MPVIERLRPRAKDLGGGFTVRRLLPAYPRQSVGPFVFFDHFGPVTAQPGDDHDVRPHPHIGLATVTYLFEGAMMHRDSLGIVQRIEPGAINWMTAGRGIVHSERTPDDLRDTAHVTHGLQLWAALPTAHEEDAASFTHTPASAIPSWSLPGVEGRVLIGEAFGRKSPVATFAATLYLHLDAQAGATITLPASDATSERAVYSVDAPLAIDGTDVPAFTMAVLAPGADATIVAPAGARYAVIGGAPLDGPRFIWWNFVSSRKERIEQAKGDWQAQRMGTIPDEHEWIPLPP
jgi:redox-sensitive bicupin YhaK (pirin superfamily)